MLFSMAKPFLHQRTTDAIMFHANYESLYQYVDKDILPNEYGGTGGFVDEMIEAWHKELEEHREDILALESINSDCTVNDQLSEA